MTGKIIIISAPSGCGKSTIIGQLMKMPRLDLQFSVSATNRPPRTGEIDGVNYFFLTTEEFRHRIDDNQFVEWEEVYEGRYYGTLKSEIDRIVSLGHNVILDLDVKGGINVKKMLADQVLSIFIKPPSVDELRRRLEGRATDSAEEIDRRVAKAEFELSFAEQFDCQVVNDDLDVAVDRTRSLIENFFFSENNG